MSSRITRSAARLAGDVPPTAVDQPPSTADSTSTPSNSRKRKAPAQSDRFLELSVPSNNKARSNTQFKKQKTALESPSSPKILRSRQRGANKHVHMAKPGYADSPSLISYSADLGKGHRQATFVIKNCLHRQQQRPPTKNLLDGARKLYQK